MRSVLLAVLIGLALAAPAQAAPRAVGCGAGFTEHEERGLRMFGAYRGGDLALYACTAGRSRPVRFWRVSPATTPVLVVHGRTGSRVGFSLEEFADGGNGVWVGWFDVRTRRWALREIRGPASRPDPEEDGSDFTPHPDALAVGRDGSIAYAFEAGGATYELFHRAAAARGLARRERRVARVAKADFEPLSLAAARRVVTWRARGAERNAPLAPGGAVTPPATGAQRRPSCDAGEGLYSDDAVRVFSTATGLHACRLARGARAVRVARRGRLSLVARARRMLGFVVRHGRRVTAGSLGIRTGALRTRGLRGTPPTGLAVGVDGGVAYDQARTVSYLPVDGARFGEPRRLATVGPGELDPQTLRLTTTAVTWRTIGAPRRVAVG